MCCGLGWGIGDRFSRKDFLGQNIDVAGWIGIGFITVGLMIIAQYSNIDV